MLHSDVLFKAVWSINKDIFSLNALKTTTLLVSLSTYFVVININNLARLFQTLYQSSADHLVAKMSKDSVSEWQQRGLLFHKFANDREVQIRPSNWRLLQYGFQTYIISGIGTCVKSWASQSLLRLRHINEQELPMLEDSVPRYTKEKNPFIAELIKRMHEMTPIYTDEMLPTKLRHQDSRTMATANTDPDVVLGLNDLLPELSPVRPEMETFPVADGEEECHTTAPVVIPKDFDQEEIHTDLVAPTDPGSELADQESTHVPSTGQVLEEGEENGLHFAEI